MMPAVLSDAETSIYCCQLHFSRQLTAGVQAQRVRRVQWQWQRANADSLAWLKRHDSNIATWMLPSNCTNCQQQ